LLHRSNTDETHTKNNAPTNTVAYFSW